MRTFRPALLTTLLFAFCRPLLAADADTGPLHAALLNNSYQLGGRSYALQNGSYGTPTDNLALGVLDEWIRTGDLNSDGRADAVAPISMTSKTSGIFHYLIAVLDNGEGKYTPASGYLGDRLKLESVEFDDNNLRVDVAHFAYLDHLCCPSLRTVRTFTLRQDQLICQSSSALTLRPEDVQISAESPVPGMFRFAEIGQPKLRNTPPLINAYPEHVRIALGEQVTAGLFTPAEPQLRIFPVDEYKKIMDPAELKIFEDQFDLFQSLILEKSAVPSKPIPLFPAVKEARKVQAQPQRVIFQNGRGVRFVTAAGKNLLYIFEGLSSDDKHLVFFSARLAPADGSVVPASAQPVTAEQLAGLPLDSYAPSATALDQWLSSLKLPD